MDAEQDFNPIPEPTPSEEVTPHPDAPNTLWDYVQSLQPEIVEHLSRPASPETAQVMERNIHGLLGNLPSEHFHVTITVNRENLGRLLASAMVSGYFLRNVEQRLQIERSLGLPPAPAPETLPAITPEPAPDTTL